MRQSSTEQLGEASLKDNTLDWKDSEIFYYTVIDF